MNKVEFAYLDTIKVKDFFSIKDIEIHNLGDKKEICIVGENGDGKTLLLQAILLGLKNTNSLNGIIYDYLSMIESDFIILIRDNNKKGYFLIPHSIRIIKAKDKILSNIENMQNIDKRINSSNEKFIKATVTLEKISQVQDGLNFLENVFAYGANRRRNDSDKKDEYGYLTLFDNEQYLYNPQKWLIELYNKQNAGITNGISLEVAKKMLIEILDNNIDMDITYNSITFYERGSKVEFDNLSEGYKIVMIMICDLLYRLSKNQPNISSMNDYKAIVLIDEIELHLHPKWQKTIIKKLRDWFPKIQWIFTTHSPTVVLGCSDDCTFIKLYKDKSEIKALNPIDKIDNLSLNHLVTSPLFGLDDGYNIYSTDDVSTTKDFIYEIIHEEIKNDIKNRNDIDIKSIKDMIKQSIQKHKNGQSN